MKRSLVEGKKSSLFGGKNVTPSVTAPGDTSLSDATAYSSTGTAGYITGAQKDIMNVGEVLEIHL